MNLLIRVLVLAYFPAFFVGVGLSKFAGADLLRGLPLAIATSMVLIPAARVAVRFPGRAFGPVKPILPVCLYTVLYGVLYFPRAFPGVDALGLVPSLTLHVLFWHTAYWSPVYVRARSKFFADLSNGLLFGFAVGFLGALQGAGWSLQPGALHNLSEQATFVRSDLDVPLLAVVVGIVAMGAILRGPRAVHSGVAEWLVGGHRRLGGILLLALPLGALFVYNRRVPIAALLVGIAVFQLSYRYAGVMLAPLVAAPLAPLLWQRLVPIMLVVTQNPVVSAILARNDVESYTTASNRLDTWSTTLRFLADVRPGHFYGYGGAPEQLLPVGLPWEHVHNGPMEAVLDAGIPVLLLAIVLAGVAVARLRSVIRHRTFAGPAALAYSILAVWLVEAAVEPALRGYSIIHMLFLLAITLAIDMHSEIGIEGTRLANESRRRRPMSAIASNALPSDGRGSP